MLKHRFGREFGIGEFRFQASPTRAFLSSLFGVVREPRGFIKSLSARFRFGRGAHSRIKSELRARCIFGFAKRQTLSQKGARFEVLVAQETGAFVPFRGGFAPQISFFKRQRASLRALRGEGFVT